MTEMTINKLPSKTWYWLHVNETKLPWDKEHTTELPEETVTAGSTEEVRFSITGEGRYSSKKIHIIAPAGKQVTVFMAVSYTHLDVYKRQNIMCINYQDYYKNIKKMISEETGKLIVIDNADILLDDDTRKYISMDHKNQYLIIGRNPKNLFTTSDNLFELVSEKKGGAYGI